MIDRFADWANRMAGSPTAFLLACALIAGWSIGGLAFGFTDSWQILINTVTTIVTFLMVFLIQSASNRAEVQRDRQLGEIQAIVRAELAELRALDTIRQNVAEVKDTVT